jgi:hypothetical protein
VARKLPASGPVKIPLAGFESLRLRRHAPNYLDTIAPEYLTVCETLSDLLPE